MKGGGPRRVHRPSAFTTGGICRRGCRAAAWPAGERRPCPAPGAQPADRAEAAEVRRGSGDVRAAAQRAQVQVRVVPAHPVEQPGQPGRGPGGDEELCTAGRRHRHRAQRQAHPLHPHQCAPPRRLGDVEHVERPAHGEQHRGARHLGPGVRGHAEGGARRHLAGEVQRVRAGGGARRVTARADARRGAGTRRHRPAPESCVFGDRGRPGSTAAPSRAGPHLPDAADREAHAPSNGCDSPVVTTGVRDVLRRRGSAGARGGVAGVCEVDRAPLSASLRLLLIATCQVNRGLRRTG